MQADKQTRPQNEKSAETRKKVGKPFCFEKNNKNESNRERATNELKLRGPTYGVHFTCCFEAPEPASEHLPVVARQVEQVALEVRRHADVHAGS